jgi:putative hydrolase of the HAD superfamily
VIFAIIQNVDRASDRLNEISGKKLATELMYRTILKRLGYKSSLIDYNLLSEIKLQVNELYYEYQPMLLNDNIIKMLVQLKREGYSLNISSNTGFIEGAYLIKSSKLIELFGLFDFAVFSDEINASKPSSGFYENVFTRINGDKQEILHIGDNYRTDYLGALSFGFNALLIDNREYSIELIKKKIDEKNRGF